MKVIVEAKNIEKEYLMGQSVVHALRGVDVTVHEKDFIVILGPSGSGKSTLLHLLGALDHPSKGRVFFEGKDISLLDDWHLAMIRRNKIGFIFQAFNLIPTLTALENVLIPTIPMSIDKDAAEERARKLLSIVGLESRLSHKPKELSGGEMQRVSIARALINNPAILYCDEPTGNLDSVTGKQIVELMKSLNDKEDKTFVIVTHDPGLVKYANKVFYMKDGMIMKDHTKEIRLLQKIRG